MPTRLPWWLSGKASICQCRRPEFRPWSGRISQHAGVKPTFVTIGPVLWSPRATAAEPTCRNYQSPRALEPIFATREDTPVRSLAPQREQAPPHNSRKACAAVKTSVDKNKLINYIKPTQTMAQVSYNN